MHSSSNGAQAAAPMSDISLERQHCNPYFQQHFLGLLQCTSKGPTVQNSVCSTLQASTVKCRVPLITTFLAAFQDSKQIYIVMEHCSGGDLLEQLLKEGRAMTEQRVALEVALPILTALSHIHQLRIIHRWVVILCLLCMLMSCIIHLCNLQTLRCLLRVCNAACQ